MKKKMCTFEVPFNVLCAITEYFVMNHNLTYYLI